MSKTIISSKARVFPEAVNEARILATLISACDYGSTANALFVRSRIEHIFRSCGWRGLLEVYRELDQELSNDGYMGIFETMWYDGACRVDILLPKDIDVDMKPHKVLHITVDRYAETYHRWCEDSRHKAC